MGEVEEAGGGKKAKRVNDASHTAREKRRGRRGGGKKGRGGEWANEFRYVGQEQGYGS